MIVESQVMEVVPKKPFLRMFVCAVLNVFAIGRHKTRLDCVFESRLLSVVAISIEAGGALKRCGMRREMGRVTRL
jgi:hypothetical protein